MDKPQLSFLNVTSSFSPYKFPDVLQCDLSSLLSVRATQLYGKWGTDPFSASNFPHYLVLLVQNMNIVSDLRLTITFLQKTGCMKTQKLYAWLYISHQALWSCWDYTKNPESFPGKWAFAFYRIFAVIFLLSLIYNFVYFLDMNTDIWGEEIADCKYIFLWQSHPSNLCWPYEYLGS